jgi:hypothetical protein
MYGYHLWIVLSESTQESDVGTLAQKIQALRVLVSEELASLSAEPICQVNCDWVFQCSVSRNHKGGEHERLQRILAWIVDRLPGSYGLVYVRDDEDSVVSDLYSVLVIARGSVEERADVFLSPIVPTIED